MATVRASDTRPVLRPWGTYTALIRGDGFQVKHIVVAPGGTLSLQLHRRRSEHWVVVRGEGRITCGDQVMMLGRNQSIHIPIGMKHRLENTGPSPLELIEVQCGDYLGEDDIVRLADIYGRA